MKQPARAIAKTDQQLGRGMDFAVTILLFFGIGFGLDRWLGTTPVFMVALSLIGMVGQLVRSWYSYDSAMKQLESERAEAVKGHSR